MALDRKDRVQEFFEAALKLPSEERASFLAEACGDDAELRAEVESLLEHDELAGSDFMQPLEPPTVRHRNTEAPLTGEKRAGESRVNTLPSPRQQSTTPHPAQSPSIPDYELIQFVGKGGFGQVWLAKQRLTGVLCAVKVIPRDRIGDVELDGIREYKQRAAGHPHLVNLEHVGETEDCYYCVMELADDARGSGVRTPEGYEPMTLAERIKRTGALPAQVAADICVQILEGLEHLHEAGLLHRDVKPANVLQKDGRWQLGDMGLVTSHSHMKNRAGTPIYAPPEGVVDRSGDLFCVGRLLIELIGGAPPETSVDPQRIPAPGDSRLARRITDVVARACEPDPKKRYQTAAEMRTALRPSTPVGRRWLRPVAVGLTAVALLLLAWWTGLTQFASQAPSGDPVLEVVFKTSEDAVGHYKLNVRNVPLRTGSLIQVHAELAAPGYPYLFHISNSDPPMLLYPALGSPIESVETFDSPPDAIEARQPQDWHKLSPPAGTEMLLLLVAESRVQDTDALVAELAALRPPPLEGHSILVGNADRPELRWDTSRGLKPSSATAPKGMLNMLGDDWRSRFRHVRVLAFPHVGHESNDAGG